MVLSSLEVFLWVARSRAFCRQASTALHQQPNSGIWGDASVGQLRRKFAGRRSPHYDRILYQKSDPIQLRDKNLPEEGERWIHSASSEVFYP
ncbi:hypothetical protein NG796_13690 [Laspinema sp. A4]|uniref:hypothetical protein n=1 Tax=Laspinema sp. D2d TaxID=2953686 RepID=UPI0021BAD97F|nr:hypothetical protein [Laspinema sp. D2d]MCT7984351.1 hypothetical protein [Laspinema sp. D2d]